MAISPCSLCQQRFLGPAITGYHSWYVESTRYGYKQKICPPCAKQRLETYIRWSIDQKDPDVQFPDTCPSCGVAIDDALETTYSTWFHGKQRRDRVLVTCFDCALKIRAVFVEGGERLEDRAALGVGERGAPRPNPEGLGDFADLPW